MKRIVTILLSLTLLLSMVSALAIEAGAARAVIGADLSEDQIRSVYNTFGINRGDVSELRVSNWEERQYLEGLVDNSKIGTSSISCVYLETLPTGSGLSISVSNVDWCTQITYQNALVTAGITDAKVIVTSPYTVSGTAALTGIYKAYENITGETLDEIAKAVGTQELVITNDLAQQIGDIDAASIVNELKLILDETKNMTDTELRAEIAKISQSYSVNLTDTMINQLINLCRECENLSTDELKKKVESVQSTIKNLATAQENATKVLSGIQGFFQKVGEWFGNLFGRFSGN